MKLATFVPVLSLMAASCSALPQLKRATTTILYAYGTNITGFPILYGNTDGLAYISSNASSSYSSLTWDIDSTGVDAWNATFTSGTHNSTTTGAFYIVDGDTSFASAGFITENSTTNAINATTSGFYMFGGQVVHISDEDYEAQFWAQTTATEGVWSLMWNSNGKSQDNSVPVTVKKIAPTVPT